MNNESKAELISFISQAKRTNIDSDLNEPKEKISKTSNEDVISKHDDSQRFSISIRDHNGKEKIIKMKRLKKGIRLKKCVVEDVNDDIFMDDKNYFDNKKNDKSLLNEILALGKNNIFKCKAFKIGKNIRYYAPVYNFFMSKTKFESDDNTFSKFRCIVCSAICNVKLGESTNLTKHIKKHIECQDWLHNYNLNKGTKRDAIDPDTLSIIKFFISSNTSMIALKNKHLRDYMSRHNIKLPCHNTFVDSYIPNVLSKLYKVIESRLQKASCISLIADIWTNKNMLDFIGVAANLTYRNFQSECLVIGLMEMKERHTHSAIKKAIEQVLSNYDFDKSKIRAITTDDGSSFVKAFKINSDVIKDDFKKSIPSDDNDEVEGESSSVSPEFDNEENLRQLDEVNKEVDDLQNELSELEFKHQIDLNIEKNDKNFVEVPITDYDDGQFYDLEKGEPIFENAFVIDLQNVRRYSCSAHKANIGVRSAIHQCDTISSILEKLSKFAFDTKKSIALSKVFTKAKSKLKTNNKTRWSSDFLMLESYLRAYMKDIFQENQCPVDRKTIEEYLGILIHAYRFSLHQQKTDSSIAEVVPGVMLIINAWKKMKLRGNPSDFRNLLIAHFKRKFDYELNSEVYQVAALLDVKNACQWINEPIFHEIVSSALKNLSKVILDTHSNQKLKVKTITKKASENPTDFYGHYLNKTQIKVESFDSKIVSSINSEIDEYRALLEESQSLRENNISTRKFWHDNSTRFPALSETALQLLSIPASSAFIERFFSLCGAICKPRCGNMNAQTIVYRCMLKANIDLLSNMTT